MHKKLAQELNSLAHDILKMRDKNDVFALKRKAQEVYEKLSLLAYVEEYINTTPQATQTKEELIATIEQIENRKEVVDNPIVEESVTNQIEDETTNELIEEIHLKTKDDTPSTIEVQKISKPNIVEEITEQPFDELESIIFEDIATKNDADFIEEQKSPTLEEELQDTLPVDVMADLFTKAEPKKSLNDKLQNTIQIGLNDRIAFVTHLFEGNQQDFNRVISQLNTKTTEQEAKVFINKIVKPDYNWSNKEEYEIRLLEIIERRFA